MKRKSSPPVFKEYAQGQIVLYTFEENIPERVQRFMN